MLHLYYRLSLHFPVWALLTKSVHSGTKQVSSAVDLDFLWSVLEKVLKMLLSDHQSSEMTH